MCRKATIYHAQLAFEINHRVCNAHRPPKPITVVGAAASPDTLAHPGAEHRLQPPWSVSVAQGNRCYFKPFCKARPSSAESGFNWPIQTKHLIINNYSFAHFVTRREYCHLQRGLVRLPGFAFKQSCTDHGHNPLGDIT